MPPKISEPTAIPEIKENQVPRLIFQTWKNKTLPPKMANTVHNLIKANPTFTHFLYDDNDCYDFINTHFHENVAKTFIKLIPGAYKADLWRYCCLYINGGIYIDIKFITTPGFKLESLLDNEYFVKDKAEGKNFGDGFGVYNSFFVVHPKNPALKLCIDEIVIRCRYNDKGSTPLHTTGPKLLGRFLKIEQCTLTNNKGNIAFIKRPSVNILEQYLGYRDEQRLLKTLTYEELWMLDRVYKK